MAEFDVTIPWSFKALPTTEQPLKLSEIGGLGWHLWQEDVMFPAAVIRKSALEHNRQWMRRFLTEAGVEICPHGKTTMSPQLIAMQIEDGAWGMTAATVAQVRIYRKHGIDRIILANQLVGKQDILYIIEELRRDPHFDFYCLADSLKGVELLESAVLESGLAQPLQVLLELGLRGGRSGMRDDEEAIEIARRIFHSPALALSGVEGFEGISQTKANGDDQASQLLQRIVHVAEQCDAQSLFERPPVISAGGSSYFDLATQFLSSARLSERFKVVLRSGCYLVHDSGLYHKMMASMAARTPGISALGPGLQSALEVWAYVLSCPEQGQVIAGLGKRDASFDVDLPAPLTYVKSSDRSSAHPLSGDYTVRRLDDHHAYLDVPATSPLEVGDLICFGISHPCTTFDRWPFLYLVDDDYLIEGAIQTLF